MPSKSALWIRIQNFQGWLDPDPNPNPAFFTSTSVQLGHYYYVGIV
jgi:hypothetical protein